MQQLHWQELPVAALTRLTALVHASDSAAVPPLADYCQFRPEQPGEKPPVAAGAAMLELIRRRLFPGFALAFYDALYQVGEGQPIPQPLALIADDAILLAPRPRADRSGWDGFLIAEGPAQGQVRSFRWPDQAPDQAAVWLTVPRASSGGGAVWAEEGASLAIRQSPPAPGPPPARPQ